MDKKFIFFMFIICQIILMGQQNLEELSKKNDEIKILEEFKDSKEMLEIKLYQVEKINKYRRKMGLNDVEFDILAARVGNMHTYNSVIKGYRSHWDDNGYKPYIRYGINGGVDHVQENYFAVWQEYGGEITGADIDKYGASMKSREKVVAVMREGVDGFMAEGPGGGHYENIMNPVHNYVGIGYYGGNKVLGKRLFARSAYCEEFLDKYIEFDNFKKELKVGESVEISGKVIPQDTGVYAIIAYYEPIPSKMTSAELNLKGSYPDFTEKIFQKKWPWEINFDKKTRKFKYLFKPEQKGFYYIHVFIKKGIDEIPYEPQGSATVSTKGANNVSGIILKIY